MNDAPFVAVHEFGIGPSRQMAMPCLRVRFRGIAEVDRRALPAGHDAIDPTAT